MPVGKAIYGDIWLNPALFSFKMYCLQKHTIVHRRDIQTKNK